MPAGRQATGARFHAPVTSLGPIVLHGGGEFQSGDEAVLTALLTMAAGPADARAGACLPGTSSEATARRIVIVPTAAARQGPERAARHGMEAFRAAAHEAGVAVRLETALVVDPASAASGPIAGRIAGADLVYVPGGDPDVIPILWPGSLASQALLAARARGAVICGASAGAMALAEWCWTPTGIVPGLGWVRGVAVAPHWTLDDRGSRAALRRSLPPGIGILGLAERTAGVEARDRSGSPGDARWRIIGEGRAAWYPPGADAPAEVAGDGGALVGWA